MKGRPTATKIILEARANLLSGLRSFFEARQSLEVDVPAIAKAPASDPWLDSFAVSDPAGLHIGYLLPTRTFTMTYHHQYRKDIIEDVFRWLDKDKTKIIKHF